MIFAIPFDHPRKKGKMTQKANVSHGKTKMDKERVTLRSSFKVAVYSESRSCCGFNVDGKYA
jgi:hypothetical protein